MLILCHSGHFGPLKLCGTSSSQNSLVRCWACKTYYCHGWVWSNFKIFFYPRNKNSFVVQAPWFHIIQFLFSNYDLSNLPPFQFSYFPSSRGPTLSTSTPFGYIYTLLTIMRSFATTTFFLLAAASPLLVSGQSFFPGVIATGTQGPTNPPQATMGTAINQTSMARLLSVNSVDVSWSNIWWCCSIDKSSPLGFLSLCASADGKHFWLRGTFLCIRNEHIYMNVLDHWSCMVHKAAQQCPANSGWYSLGGSVP